MKFIKKFISTNGKTDIALVVQWLMLLGFLLMMLIIALFKWYA